MNLLISACRAANVATPILDQPSSTQANPILDQWMELDDTGNVTEITSLQGDTLVFGSEPFRWEEVYAAPGSVRDWVYH